MPKKSVHFFSSFSLFFSPGVCDLSHQHKARLQDLNSVRDLGSFSVLFFFFFPSRIFIPRNSRIIRTKLGVGLLLAYRVRGRDLGLSALLLLNAMIG